MLDEFHGVESTIFTSPEVFSKPLIAISRASGRSSCEPFGNLRSWSISSFWFSLNFISPFSIKGLSFCILFLLFAILVSELLSFFFDEGLLSPVQLAFHTSAFIGYVFTFRYIYKNQDYLEYKGRDIIKKQIKEDENIF